MLALALCSMLVAIYFVMPSITLRAGSSTGPTQSIVSVDIAGFRVSKDHFSVIDSTQTHLECIGLERLAGWQGRGPIPVHVCSADHQEKGRGKGDRKWFSDPSHRAVAMSILFPVPVSLLNRSALTTQILALSVAEAIDAAIGSQVVRLKWPNDLIVEDHKVGGILAQLLPLDGEFNAVIVGVGINVDIPDASLVAGVGDGARWPPGSLKQLSGTDVDPANLRGAIIDAFLPKLHAFLHSGDLHDMTDLISQRQLCYRSSVRFLPTDGASVVEGVHSGLSFDGGLMVKVNGQTTTYYSGEIVRLYPVWLLRRFCVANVVVVPKCMH